MAAIIRQDALGTSLAEGGIEVEIQVDGPVITTSSVTLYPELAIELAESLIEHARRAGARYDRLVGDGR